MVEPSFTLGDLRTNADYVSRLLEVALKGDPLQLNALANRFHGLALLHPGHKTRPAMLLNVPGRIEVLGKHTDYAGGVSLTCASRSSMASLVTSHALPSLIVMDAVRGIQVELPYDNPEGVTGHSWTRYAATVLARLIRHFGTPELGVSVVLGSNLPSASGMSSSSGLVITIAMALLGMGRFPLARNFSISRERFAGFAGALESGADFEDLAGDEGVGTKGGSQDHTAILCSEAGSLGLYSYFPVHREGHAPLADSLTFVVAASGVKARKTGEAKEAYNKASQRAREVVATFNEIEGLELGTMGEMIIHPAFSRDRLRDALMGKGGRESLWNRFAQFDRECGVVIPGAMEALKNGQWDSFGKFVDESQRMADVWLGNQVPETNDLVRLAREAGAAGASAFGAGFGGAVWALIEKDDAERFMSDWMGAYSQRHPSRMSGARFFAETPSQGVMVLGAAGFSFS